MGSVRAAPAARLGRAPGFDDLAPAVMAARLADVMGAFEFATVGALVGPRYRQTIMRPAQVAF